ncbi:uncharacterized protein N7483_007155 [Penicillium malachiteum]|uniref:uncharacterized protein n=1 Tax=Penicillium malachiteum TaxID=1324776 RepID=UPI002547E261|nr:uncharacterized protein N7483_007155 [Penicillium malachiteum]KAJ5725798.1 hypothetical protein N7483_007155 [Penicillium malachiteum]
MCHSIVWYYALCQHLDEAQSLIIACDRATTTGYDCLPTDQPTLSLPISGACYPCKHQYRKEAYMMQPETAKPSPEVEIEAAAGTGAETEARDETNAEVQTRNDKRDVGNEDYDDTMPEPDPIPGYHTHLYPQLEGYVKKKSNWESLEEIEVEDGDEESEEPCKSSFFLDDEESLVSSPVSEKWCGNEFDVPDSPTFGCIAEKWRSTSLPCPTIQRQSRIPVPVPGNEATKRHNTWNTYELELFDELTF